MRDLDEVPLELKRTTLERRDRLTLEDISFASLGGVRLHGYLLRGTGAAPRPLVVHSHGYGGSCSPNWGWAQAGVDVVGVDIRGWGRSAAALAHRSPWGYMLTGAETPERYVLRGAVCDYLRAARAGREALEAAGGGQPGERAGRTVFHGVSFAGGLALMAAAVADPPDLLAVGVPTFGWAEGRRFFVRSGSGAEINAYLDRQPGYAAEDLMVVLRYFDPINFADAIRSPALVAYGRRDDVVPAETVEAIVAHLSGPHEVMRFPVSHSESPQEREWVRFDRRFLQLAVGGVPAGFGAGRPETPR